MIVPQPITIASHRIHPNTRPGYVHLKVADIERQLAFYQNVLGLRLNWRNQKSAGLGVEGEDIVRMTEIPNGRRYRGVTGIYHFAILFPTAASWPERLLAFSPCAGPITQRIM